MRSALHAGERLHYHATGYRLDLADGELDASEFERLVAAARSATASGDQQRALDRLDAGLALWRGDTLAEFADRDFARAEAARLDELRLCAAESAPTRYCIWGETPRRRPRRRGWSGDSPPASDRSCC